MSDVVQSQIIVKLTEAFGPVHLTVENESYQHSVPPGSETHFRVVIVSENFAGLNRVRRQQAVYAILAEELKSGVHALGLQTFTPAEWQAQPLAVVSPECSSK